MAGANDATNLALAGRAVIDDIRWYVPLYIPSISIQKIKLGHIASRTATELSFIERSSHTKDETTETKWTFEFDVGDGIVVPIYIKVGFRQRDQFNQQHQKFIHFIEQV